MSITIDNNVIISTLFILGLTFSTVAVLLSSLALFKILAFEKNTHTIQYTTPDQLNASSESDNSWATSDEVINKQQKLYREDLEEQMPDFVVDKEETYTYQDNI